MKCATCKYSHAASVTELQCRRYPPTVTIEKQRRRSAHYDYDVEVVLSRFVEVDTNEWCGEYVERAP